MNCITIFKEILPSSLWKLIRVLYYKLPFAPFYGIIGGFSSWEEAKSYCAKHQHQSCYEADNILTKVASAIQEVRKGNAEFERDGVLFHEKDYNFQLLSALFLSINGVGESRSIDVVDFGGSLGSTFFQNRSLFDILTISPHWTVIEQKQFVDLGKKEVPEISFYYNMDEYLDSGGQCDILLLSSVLEYMEFPYEVLSSLIKHNWKYVIIDRSLYHTDVGKECVAVQIVPPFLYDAYYPLWLRDSEKQHTILRDNGYEIVLEWSLPFKIQYKDKEKKSVLDFYGYLYKKIKTI